MPSDEAGGKPGDEGWKPEEKGQGAPGGAGGGAGRVVGQGVAPGPIVQAFIALTPLQRSVSEDSYTTRS